MNDSGMEVNKIAGAIFLAGIIAMVSGFMSQGLYAGSDSHHDGKEAKRGYSIEVAENTQGGGAPKAEEGPLDILPLMATADLEKGKKLLKKCTACHTFDDGGKNGVGPNQWGLVGRKIAGVSGYKYSSTLTDMSNKSWGFQELSEFLTKPRKYAPGNKMSFAGMKKPQDRANLIAYMNTLGNAPLPLP